MRARLSKHIIGTLMPSGSATVVEEALTENALDTDFVLSGSFEV